MLLHLIKKVKINQINPYIVLKYTNHAVIDGENKSATYIPIGVTYFTKSKINLHLDVGPAYFYHISPGYKPTAAEKIKHPYSNYGIWGNFKVSFRF